MNQTMKKGVIITTVFLLSACSGLGVKDDDVVGAGTSAPVEDAGSATTSAADQLGYIQGIAIDQEDSPDYVRTVYFEYDSSEVRPEFIPVIVAHGELLASDSGKRMLLEGHADERGSREYNIALGERRALSVRRLLLGSGASDNQIRVVSYGEERPAVIGHSEDAWSKNRRSELRYE